MYSIGVKMEVREGEGGGGKGREEERGEGGGLIGVVYWGCLFY